MDKISTNSLIDYGISKQDRNTRKRSDMYGKISIADMMISSAKA